MAESCVALGTFAKGIIRARWCIIAFWVVAALLAALGAINFLSVTSLPFDPPPGTQAVSANAHFKSVFPSRSQATQFVGLIEAQPGVKALDIPNLAPFSYALRAALNTTGQLVTFTSNTTLWGDLGISSLGLVNGSATLIQWEIAANPTSKTSLDFAKSCEKTFNEQVDKYLSGLAFHGLVSVPTVCNVGVEDSEKSLAQMDAIAMPIAVLVLWYIIQSGRLLLLPLVTMGTAASVSFGVMYCVGKVTVVEETTPSLMMSLLIAMSIDYSLFLLTRFREELQLLEPQEAQDAGSILGCIEVTMQTAGFTVLLSGLTLTASFLGVAFFPVEIISSLGVGCAVSLFLTLVVHLTLGPAMLAAFPCFFGQCISSQRLGARCARRLCGLCGRRAVELPTALPAEGRRPLQEESSNAALVPRAGKAYHPCWIWLARVTTSFPTNLLTVALVLAATAAVGWPVLNMHTTDNMLMSVPHGTPLYASYTSMIDDFGIGAIAPYQLLLEPLDGGSVLEEVFWNQSQIVLERLAAELPQTQKEDFQFMNFAGALPDPKVEYAGLQQCLKAPSVPACRQLLYAVNTFCNPQRTAAFGYITLKFDPFGNDGPTWLDSARKLAVSVGAEHNVRVTVVGTAADALDIVTKVYQVVPYMVIGTLAVALLLLGLAFRSLLMPLRSVASICLTLLWVYGLSVLTYQDGILEWTSISGVTGTFKSQNWMIPVICFSIVVGICLDYDIFLLSRTTEFRESGMSAIEAIQHGLCGTGGIITAAGAVMAIAFGGLLFSSMLVVNGLAFYMVVAVLYDTLVIRCLLTPAAMSLLGRWNWWPSPLCKDE